MSNLISANIQKLVKLSQSIAHNLRFKRPSYLVDNNTKNINQTNNKQMIKLMKKLNGKTLEYKRAFIDKYQQKIETAIKNDYLKHNKQKMQASTQLLHECVISFGRSQFEKNDVNDINKKITEYTREFEKKYNVHVISHSLHLDEGHKNEKGEILKNYHCHFQILNYSEKTHKTGLRACNFKKLQTELAEKFETLGFKRGRDYSAEQKQENINALEQGREAIKIARPVNISHKAYRQAREAVKSELRAENNALNLKNLELKDKNKELTEINEKLMKNHENLKNFDDVAELVPALSAIKKNCSKKALENIKQSIKIIQNEPTAGNSFLVYQKKFLNWIDDLIEKQKLKELLNLQKDKQRTM
jgi:hypothetical protein